MGGIGVQVWLLVQVGEGLEVPCWRCPEAASCCPPSRRWLGALNVLRGLFRRIRVWGARFWGVRNRGILRMGVLVVGPPTLRTLSGGGGTLVRAGSVNAFVPVSGEAGRGCRAVCVSLHIGYHCTDVGCGYTECCCPAGARHPHLPFLPYDPAVRTARSRTAYDCPACCCPAGCFLPSCLNMAADNGSGPAASACSVARPAADLDPRPPAALFSATE